jgi:ABC-2 type transport system permease protein
MLPITWRTIKDKRISLTIFTLATVGMLWVYVGMFPGIQRESQKLTEAFKSYPEAMLKAFNIESLDFSKLENFVAMEQYSIIWPLIVLFLLISFAGTSLAGEVEKGTVESLLSRPVSRSRVFFQKYLAGILVLIGYTTVSVFAIWPLAALQHINFKMENFVLVYWLCLLFGWAVYSLAMLCSAWFSERSRVYGIAGGVLILMYVVNIIAALRENLGWLKYCSFFHYYNSTAALVKGEFDMLSVLVFAGIAVVVTAVAAWRFQKRDVAA